VKYDLTRHNINIKGTLKIISDSYKIKNDGLVDSIKYLLSKTGTFKFDNEAKLLLKLLLTVQF
jgi:hypothetical protein